MIPDGIEKLFSMTRFSEIDEWLDEDFNKLEGISAFCAQAVRVAGRFESLWMIVNGDSFLWRRAYRNINLHDTKSAGLLHA